MGFLDGVRVVDATRLFPGGYATMLLSDMGAEVTKVEQPGLGDYMRATPPTKRGKSPVHDIVNRNKSSIGVDLKSKEGRGVMRRLLERADVFVEGFRPGAMKRLGFSYEEVKTISPKIVYCSISAYGQKSPLSSMPGHDVNFQAMAGTLSYGPPTPPLLQLGDLASGMHAALAILGALAGRRGPVYIDVPIVPSLASWMVLPAATYIATGEEPVPGHSLIFGSTPYYSIYPTSDGRHVAVAAIEERFWHNLVVALGVPELEGKRFGSPPERRQVKSTLKKIFSARTRDHWARLLMHKDTCVTPVLTVSEALQSDWAKAAGALVRVPHSGHVLGAPVLSRPRMRSKPQTQAPELGADTPRILESLGYSRAEVARLRRSHAVQ
ncbi:MAG: CoA transferase [archaeon]|nr:MAG: CoA transferase [archaeon]